MVTLISVPDALTGHFHELSGLSKEECFVASDPKNQKLGSGGGTANLALQAWKDREKERSLDEWLETETGVILHAGGQSRRLPAYAPSSKALIPIPVFRWMCGQRINQTLMDLQRPLLNTLLDRSPSNLKWIIASGDVLVWNDARIPNIPDADVVCVGLSESMEASSRHGVFFSPRQAPEKLSFMLQKPSPVDIAQHLADYTYQIDVGIWILSDRAMKALFAKCGWQNNSGRFANDLPENYDLYSDFGLALGETPSNPDQELSHLTTAVLTLPQGEFYHFGRCSDIISSSLGLQNRIQDPTRILSPMVKPHPSLFVQNCIYETRLTEENQNIWIENSNIGPQWKLATRHVLTGIPKCDWGLELLPGSCLDIIPYEETKWIIRPYGFSDDFSGPINLEETLWMERPAATWFSRRNLNIDSLLASQTQDIQSSPLFPIVDDISDAEELLKWMLDENPSPNPKMEATYSETQRLAAEEISNAANLSRFCKQRRELLHANLPALASNSDRSVFYQIDLDHTARLYADSNQAIITSDKKGSLFSYIRDQMFQYSVKRYRGEIDPTLENQAFSALRKAIIEPSKSLYTEPRNQALSDQVIWARSPVRIDIAGGWTDTPPYCYLNDSKVINLAVELNGQAPIQVFARVSKTPNIVIRSIDLGITEIIETYNDIANYQTVGSGFAVPKAALALAGFHPDFQEPQSYSSLKDQLKAFGGGIEISMLCAIPKGSGLGTSSVLSATTLGALSELCGFGWDKIAVSNRALILEQMLTTGGGWQDQYGGILPGVKQLRTAKGLDQTPEVRWLPDSLFTESQYTSNMLLYYTGVTRVAKNLLAEIVRGMFLNNRDTLSVLEQIYQHAEHMHNVIQRGNYNDLARAINRSWKLNQQLDTGTNPPEIQEIADKVSDYTAALKLPGAGGGGYLLFLAKDVDAANRIRQTLQSDPPNNRARFVDFSVSHSGLQITKS